MYKKYKSDYPYSYTLGASPTIELLAATPELCVDIFIKSNYTDKNNALFDLCRKLNISPIVSDKQVNILSPKDNCYVCGIFAKPAETITDNANHVVLVNVSDMGNLGTIIRTCVGFGVPDIILIKPCADMYDPKVIRASMGAFFRCNVKYFDTFDEYRNFHADNNLYPFMLNAVNTIGNVMVCKPYSLIFGNESSGLDNSFTTVGESVVIPHSAEIDSLSLPVSVGIALYRFNM